MESISIELLSYKEFESELEKGLEERYPGKWKVLRDVLKVNKKKIGILIECADKISAIIYQKELYDAYQKTESMETVFEIIEGSVNNGEVYGHH